MEKMFNRLAVFVSSILALLFQGVQAADLPGISFSHHDWEIVCDNTRTCRAAGYQSEEVDLAVSVLLTRKAGPRQAVTGQLMIGSYDNDDLLKQLRSIFKLSMKINGRSLGEVSVNQKSLVADLSSKQVDALIAALARNSTIEWTSGEKVWSLSGKGAAAVLLKMDEFQGRLGTNGALVKKGARGEDAVLPALPMPVVMAAPIATSQRSSKQLANNKSKAFRNAILSFVNDDCPDRQDGDTGDAEMSTERLTNGKLLVSTLCWRAAYNEGYGYWVINENPPYHPVMVTESGSEYSAGHISSSQKGRGLGDCWSNEGWTWNGKQFIHTESSSTGMCKLVAAGGAWSLPMIVTDVRH
jgi:hypothetical protein